MKRILPALLLGLVCATRAAEAPATKLFAITITTGPAWDAAKPANEQKFFREHSANLARLRAENVSVLGGRFSDKGFLLVRAASEPDVRKARSASTKCATARSRARGISPPRAR